jgi:formate hydrogenlyase subunit 6/NADH:ubiquinone oxidoreductase subunit I
MTLGMQLKKAWYKLAIKLYIPAASRACATRWAASSRRRPRCRIPEEVHVPRKGYRGEHRLKKDEQGRMKCVACLMCQTACPAECIQIVGSAVARGRPGQDPGRLQHRHAQVHLLRDVRGSLSRATRSS